MTTVKAKTDIKKPKKGITFFFSFSKNKLHVVSIGVIYKTDAREKGLIIKQKDLNLMKVIGNRSD